VIQKYIISLPPITKKNSQQILTNHSTGKPFIAPSKQYKKYEQAAMWYLTPKPKAPLAGRYRVAAVFYMPTRRRVDLTNLLEACHDTLVFAKILADDNNTIIASVDGSRVLYDKANPRTEIFIEEMSDDDQPL
jgi:Holliday junction resolvase RusA-like endonuclease